MCRMGSTAPRLHHGAPHAPNDVRHSALALAIKSIRTRFGDRALHWGLQPHLPALSSGVPAIDAALCTAGLPRGRITEVSGDAFLGKTTLALYAIAALHRSRSDTWAAFVDADYGFDAKYAAELGVDLDRIVLVRPETAEHAYTLIVNLFNIEELQLIVIDSLTALLPSIEKMCSLEQQVHGVYTRVLVRFLQKLRPMVSRTRKCMLITNQLRYSEEHKVDVTSGGRAVIATTALRLQLRKPVVKLLSSVHWSEHTHTGRRYPEVPNDMVEVHILKGSVAVKQHGGERDQPRYPLLKHKFTAAPVL